MSLDDKSGTAATVFNLAKVRFEVAASGMSPRYSGGRFAWAAAGTGSFPCWARPAPPAEHGTAHLRSLQILKVHAFNLSNGDLV